MVSFDYYYNHVLLFHWNRLGIFSEYQKHVGIFKEKLEDQLFNLIEVWRTQKNPSQAGNWSLISKKSEI